MKKDTSTMIIKKTEYEALKAEITELNQKVEWFMEQFRLAQHHRFGASTEKSEYDQISIFNEAEVYADMNVSEPELTEIESHFRKRKRTAKERLPEDLPVEVVEHELPKEEQLCPECGGDMHVMGRETRRELVIIPASAKIREHVRKVYACRDCEKDSCGVPIKKAAVSEPVIKGSFASPEAVAYIMTQKFVMGSPLYRQEQEFVRGGINLSRQTMSNWLLRATEDWLEPIYDALHEILCGGEVLHADETTLQVLREPGKTAQQKSYMWLYRTSRYNRQGVSKVNPIVLYEYQPDRKAKRPAEFLKDFKGYLHADGYEAYHTLPEKIVVVGCWAHVRRKFSDALKILSEKDRKGSDTALGKQYCDRLFELERSFSDMTPEERYEKRQELSKPIASEFFAWAATLSDRPKTLLVSAANYAISQRNYLEQYLSDGRLEISNNRAERSIKPFVIDRKNFLFANTPRGAKASAIMFSIIETAKENGLNPYKYLTHIFKNAPNWDLKNNPIMFEFILPHLLSDSYKSSLV